jgi:hypothetical protein
MNRSRHLTDRIPAEVLERAARDGAPPPDWYSGRLQIGGAARSADRRNGTGDLTPEHLDELAKTAATRHGEAQKEKVLVQLRAAAAVPMRLVRSVAGGRRRGAPRRA